MSRRWIQYIAALVLTATCFPSAAHHAFASVFDRDSPIRVTGKVTRIDWMNPHTWFYIDVENDDGEIENWGFEMGSPNTLIRRGWNHDTLQIGEIVSVDGVRARDGTMRGAVRKVTLATGASLFGGQDESR